MLIYPLLISILTFFTFIAMNRFVLNLDECSKLRVWWENNICSSKDLEPFD